MPTLQSFSQSLIRRKYRLCCKALITQTCLQTPRVYSDNQEWSEACEFLFKAARTVLDLDVKGSTIKGWTSRLACHMQSEIPYINIFSILHLERLALDLNHALRTGAAQCEDGKDLGTSDLIYEEVFAVIMLLVDIQPVQSWRSCDTLRQLWQTRLSAYFHT